jgi:hypothetical protein
MSRYNSLFTTPGLCPGFFFLLRQLALIAFVFHDTPFCVVPYQEKQYLVGFIDIVAGREALRIKDSLTLDGRQKV